MHTQKGTLANVIDSHCHLDQCDDPYGAVGAALTAVVTIGTTPSLSQITVELAQDIEKVWAAVGIHPNEAEETSGSEARCLITKLASTPPVVAIGETGFDNHWDLKSLEAQRELFDWHVTVARTYDKPLILHVRDRQGSFAASEEAVKAITEACWPKGILHCFNGHEGLLETGLDLGWMVSFAGNLTYKNSKNLHRAAEIVPFDRLLLETDSPFLSPNPKRGQPNVPDNVWITAKFMAEIRGISVVELERQTDTNAALVFNLSGLA
jgi:TatD DNase family protein